MNNSCVTIVADDDPEEHTDTLYNIITDLRNKLSDTQQTVTQKASQVNDLTDEIGKLQQKLELQRDMISKLENTIMMLSQKRKTVKDVSTETTDLCGAQPMPSNDQPVPRADFTEARDDLEAASPQCVDGSVELTILTEESKKRRPRILLLSDDLGRFMAAEVSRILGDSYDVQSIFKPGACFSNVIADAPSLTQSFNTNDFVFLMAGSNNILRRQRFSNIFFNRLLSKMTNTNIILLTVPYQSVKMNVNDRIFKFNTALYNYCMTSELRETGNLFYCDVNYCISHKNHTASANIQLSRREKERLSVNLGKLVHSMRALNPPLEDIISQKNVVLNNNLINSNLIYIDIQENFPQCPRGHVKL